MKAEAVPSIRQGMYRILTERLAHSDNYPEDTQTLSRDQLVSYLSCNSRREPQIHHLAYDSLDLLASELSLSLLHLLFILLGVLLIGMATIGGRVSSYRGGFNVEIERFDLVRSDGARAREKPSARALVAVVFILMTKVFGKL